MIFTWKFKRVLAVLTIFNSILCENLWRINSNYCTRHVSKRLLVIFIFARHSFISSQDYVTIWRDSRVNCQQTLSCPKALYFLAIDLRIFKAPSLVIARPCSLNLGSRMFFLYPRQTLLIIKRQSTDPCRSALIPF